MRLAYGVVRLSTGVGELLESSVRPALEGKFVLASNKIDRGVRLLSTVDGLLGWKPSVRPTRFSAGQTLKGKGEGGELCAKIRTDVLL